MDALDRAADQLEVMGDRAEKLANELQNLDEEILAEPGVLKVTLEQMLSHQVALYRQVWLLSLTIKSIRDGQQIPLVS